VLQDLWACCAEFLKESLITLNPWEDDFRILGLSWNFFVVHVNEMYGLKAKVLYQGVSMQFY
jgi:hypothetical protein